MDVSRVTQTLTGKIRIAAYLLYSDRTRMGFPGTAEKDWLEAEWRVGPRAEDVRIRAYFIHRDRVWMKIEGDALGDWLEAETIEVAQERINQSIKNAA